MPNNPFNLGGWGASGEEELQLMLCRFLILTVCSWLRSYDEAEHRARWRGRPPKLFEVMGSSASLSIRLSECVLRGKNGVHVTIKQLLFL